MSLHGELTGAAARRRKRRLRSWLRHERQTVAMVLAEACHHSSGTFPPTLKERRRAGQDAFDVLWGQRTARTVGARPAPSDEVVEPQGVAVTVGYVAAPVPLLAVPLLAGAAGEAVDARTLRFLLAWSLAEKNEEEEGGVAPGILGARSGAPRVQEEEEEEEEASSSSWCPVTTLSARVPLSLFVLCCVVFPSSVDRPEMLGIMAGMYQKDRLFVRCRRFLAVACAKLVFLGFSAPRAVFLVLLSSGPLSAGPPLGLHHDRYGLD